MARVRVETWRSAYAGILPQDYLDNQISVAETSERWEQTLWLTPSRFSYLAEADRKVVGIALGGPEQTGNPVYDGEVYVLYVLPDYQGRGIGRGLLSACARELLGKQIDNLLIWVLARNPYRRFYERAGGKPARRKVIIIAGTHLMEVGYGWNRAGLLSLAHWNSPNIVVQNQS